MKGSAVCRVSRSKIESPWRYLPIVANKNKAKTSAPASRATRLQHMHDDPLQIFQQGFNFTKKTDNLMKRKKLPPFFDLSRRVGFLELDDTLQWNILASDKNRLVIGKRGRRRRSGSGG